MLKKCLLAVATLFVLTACGNEDEKLSDVEREQVIDEGTIGFEMNGEEVVAAKDIPAEDKKAILDAFDEYINAFNAEEIDRYMQLISENSKNFDYEKEKLYVAETFEKYDPKREVENVTIAKYSEKEAQVYANIKTDLIQIDTNSKHELNGRQVTVFIKEDDTWKVSIVSYMEDN
ncbi:MAG: nuclear transport factor 2 family protein [Lysinibacillus sp.]